VSAGERALCVNQGVRRTVEDVAVPCAPARSGAKKEGGTRGRSLWNEKKQGVGKAGELRREVGIRTGKVAGDAVKDRASPWQCACFTPYNRAEGCLPKINDQTVRGKVSDYPP